MIKSFKTALIWLIYVASAAFWIILTIITKHTSHDGGLYFQIPLALLPLAGGFLGLYGAREWGGLKSIMGKALTGFGNGRFKKLVWRPLAQRLRSWKQLLV